MTSVSAKFVLNSLLATSTPRLSFRSQFVTFKFIKQVSTRQSQTWT